MALLLKNLKEPINILFGSKVTNEVISCASQFPCLIKFSRQFATAQPEQSIENSVPVSMHNTVGVPDKLYRLIEMEVRGNDPAVLKSYATFTHRTANHLGIDIGKSWTPRKAHHERYTVLRSVFVNKKCRVQYEFRTYFHFTQFLRLTGSTADTFLEYIQRNLPEGVAMKVTKVAIEKVPDHIQIPTKEETISEPAQIPPKEEDH